MRAAIIAVGTELLGTDRLDTNSLTLAGVLARYGVALVRKAVVGDDEAELGREVASLLPRLELILITGGLGPTADDITRPGVARALGRGWSIDEGIVATIAERFARMGRKMPEVNRRQAEVIDGAVVLENPRGTAPGLRLSEGGTTLFLFPGVPYELEGMIARDLVPWLEGATGGAALETAVLKVACVPESRVEELLDPAYAEFGREAITVLAKPADIEVRATARGEQAERRARLAAMEERLAALLGAPVYGRGEGASLEAVVGELLARRGLTVATAESCTGGLVAERLTRVAGSSAYVAGGVVTYSNALKTLLLGVPAALIAEHGAVSEPVARAMAEGARERLGVDCSLALTGIAGPSGGTPAKPVGTVELALAGPGEAPTEALRICFPGDRRRIRQIASQVALEMLRRRLTGLPAMGQ